MLTKIIYLSMFDPSFEESAEEYCQSAFVPQVLKKKIEAFNIPIKVTNAVLMMIEICTEGNPGVSQLMLKEIINTCYLKAGDTVDFDKFVRTYPMQFPLITNPDICSKYDKMWDAQKDEDGNNKCDTVEWWMECFN